MTLFSGFSMIWIHYKDTVEVHWSENKEIIDFYSVRNQFFLFFVTSQHLKKYMILSILLVSEQIKLANVEINFLDAIIGIIQW